MSILRMLAQVMFLQSDVKFPLIWATSSESIFLHVDSPIYKEH